MTNVSNTRLRLATRASALALAQARRVAEALREASSIYAELVTIATRGDADRERSIASFGGDGAFVQELMSALRDGRADAAVHSYKDVPTDVPPDLDAGAVLARGDPRDALVTRDPSIRDIASLPRRARLGTSSLRRSAQVRATRTDVEIVPLRGNVDTRVSRVVAGELDAALLAYAGLERIGQTSRASCAPLDARAMVPAVGQGAIYVQCRAGDDVTRGLLAAVHDAQTGTAVAVERAFLRRLGGGCLAPVGAHAVRTTSGWHLDAFAGAVDGTQAMHASRSDMPVDESAAVAAAEAFADEFLAAGATAIVAAARGG